MALLDGQAQRFALTYEVVLPDELVEAQGPNAAGKRFHTMKS
jgi:hypothetical protein